MIMTIVPFYLEHAITNFKYFKEWSKFGSLLQIDQLQLGEVDMLTTEFAWYLQQIRKETSVSGFTNGSK
jgi:hypothetical protein